MSICETEIPPFAFQTGQKYVAAHYTVYFDILHYEIEKGNSVILIEGLDSYHYSNHLMKLPDSCPFCQCHLLLPLLAIRLIQCCFTSLQK